VIEGARQRAAIGFGAGTVALGVMFVYSVARCIHAERSGDSDQVFHAIVAAGIALVAGIVSGALCVLFKSPRATEGVTSPSDPLIPPYALATVSAMAGVLAWLPLLPLVSPLGYAAVAVVVGMFGLRALLPRCAGNDAISS
jgi:hypothetical protein